MGIHIEINKEWFEATKLDNGKQYLKKYPAEKELVEKFYIIDIDQPTYINDYDGDRTITVSNYEEDTDKIVNVNLECKINTEEAGIIAKMLVKMFNRLKTALESLN